MSPSIQARAGESRLVVDGHVHLHSCFDDEEFLDDAERNLTAAQRRIGLDDDAPGVLLLTESAGESAFRRLRLRAAERPAGGWSFRATREPESLLAVRGQAVRLILVAGRQVATSEGLEVLALACDATFEDGRTLDETLAEVREHGALPAVPWGFGKWWFGRGRRVQALVERERPESFFLGDNGGRPALATSHPLFAAARKRGIRVLPGSDPLPFPRQRRRVGSYGFVLSAPTDLERPAARIRAALSAGAGPIESFGAGRGLLSFFADQLSMQLHKHLRGAAS